MATSNETAAQPQPGERFLFVDLIDRFSASVVALSTVALLVMVAIIVYEVVSRYVFNEPTFWVTEISTYILLGLTYAALAQAQREGTHIQVELIIGWVSEEKRKTMELVSGWVGLLFLVFLAWQVIVFVFTEYVNDTRDWGLLSTPQWIPEVPVAIGLVSFCLAVLADLYRQRPPAGAFRRWLVPAVVVVVTAILVILGPTPAKIEGSRLDWGTVVLLIGFTVSVIAWSGVRIGLMVTAVLGALILAFIWVRGESLLPVGIMLVVTMLFMLLMGVRIAMALGVIAMLGLFILLPTPQLSLMAERAWNSLNSFTLTAVPMFVLMGSLLLRAGVTTELFDALLRWMGRLPGGIAHASVGACGVFAAVSGSSLATAATMGTVACPEMIKRGYSARLTYGVVAAGGTLGILIPPSIAMIIYGTTVGAPITVLFIAGIIPGIILMLSMMAVVYFWAVLIEGSAPRGESYSWSEKFKSLIGVLPFLILIVAVLGSLYAGVATPTEAGAIGAVVALVMCIVRGQFSWTMLYETSLDTVKVTSMLLFIVVGASILSWVFDYLRLPRTMVTVVEAAELSPVIVMLIIGLIYIVLGMFIDPISMMLMTLPVTFPIVIAMGFDPIWFGIALVMMIEVGLITPPVGIILFVLRGISGDVPLKEIVYGVLPFVGVILANVVLIYYFPEIVSWLPDQMEQ
ncbi:MAG: tripartite ATP-independent transporter DctM subunit [Gammaproteobacteria bacterium]|jgi:tripartite ATP-independent transporter DctM subunit